MLTGDIANTMMNVTTFAFIGAMLWLYFRSP
jgi:hypothetical protein